MLAASYASLSRSDLRRSEPSAERVFHHAERDVGVQRPTRAAPFDAARRHISKFGVGYIVLVEDADAPSRECRGEEGCCTPLACIPTNAIGLCPMAVGLGRGEVESANAERLSARQRSPGCGFALPGLQKQSLTSHPPPHRPSDAARVEASADVRLWPKAVSVTRVRAAHPGALLATRGKHPGAASPYPGYTMQDVGRNGIAPHVVRSSPNPVHYAFG